MGYDRLFMDNDAWKLSLDGSCEECAMIMFERIEEEEDEDEDDSNSISRGCAYL